MPSTLQYDRSAVDTLGDGPAKLALVPHPGTLNCFPRYRREETTMNNPSYFLTPDSVSIQPEPQDFEIVERNLRPLPSMPPRLKSPAHRTGLHKRPRSFRTSGLSEWDPVKIAADRDALMRAVRH